MTLPPEDVEWGGRSGERSVNLAQDRYPEGHDSWYHLEMVTKLKEGDPTNVAKEFLEWFHATFVWQQPRVVREQLKRFREFLGHDVSALTGESRTHAEFRWKSKRDRKPPLIDYLRSDLAIATGKNLQEQFSVVAECCQTLVGNRDPLDKMFLLLCTGDITDEAAVAELAEPAFDALDRSIQKADRQFRAGGRLIGPEPNVIVPSERAGQESLEGRINPQNSKNSGFMGGDELAIALGVHPSRKKAFFQRLKRERKSLGDANWCEVQNKTANDPTFLYRVDAKKVISVAADYMNPKPV
ncbi:MAG: hypothetical protein KDA84_08885 [Planctomycetaceae bacterium]|nr:hypothetical protein [Planctomycetaceae bacterium]